MSLFCYYFKIIIPYWPGSYYSVSTGPLEGFNLSSLAIFERTEEVIKAHQAADCY